MHVLIIWSLGVITGAVAALVIILAYDYRRFKMAANAAFMQLNRDLQNLKADTAALKDSKPKK